MGSLHNPSFGHIFSCFLFNLLFPAGSDVRCPSQLCEECSHLCIIIPFIQAHTAGNPGCWSSQRCKRFSQQFEIIPVCSCHRTGKRNAVFVRGQASFRPDFGSISGILSCFFPRQAELLSWPRRCCKSSSQYPVAHRIAQGCAAKFS